MIPKSQVIPSDVRDGWQVVKRQLELQADRRTWDYALRQLEIWSYADGVLVLSVATGLALSWCHDHRTQRWLKRLLADVFGCDPRDVQCEVIRRDWSEDDE